MNQDRAYETASVCDDFRECPKCGKCRNYIAASSKCQNCSTVKFLTGLCRCTEKKILEFHNVLWRGKRPSVDLRNMKLEDNNDNLK
jgi:hypothetical protein